jgi:hypothetical protein
LPRTQITIASSSPCLQFRVFHVRKLRDDLDANG